MSPSVQAAKTHLNHYLYHLLLFVCLFVASSVFLLLFLLLFCSCVVSGLTCQAEHSGIISVSTSSDHSYAIAVTVGKTQFISSTDQVVEVDRASSLLVAADGIDRCTYKFTTESGNPHQVSYVLSLMFVFVCLCVCF